MPRYVVSRFATVSWRDGEVQITSPVTRKTFRTGDASVLSLLSSFASPRTIDSGATEMIGAWIDAAILVNADSAEAPHWDRDALAFYASSHDPTWRKRRGMTTDAVAPRRSTVTISLASGGQSQSGDLAALLDTRRSRRNWARSPIGFQAFSDLLWMSARNRVDARFSRHVSRPYPSGGAAYSLELYPVLSRDAVETIDGGVYRYLPEAHALELVSPFDADWRPFLAAAGRSAGTIPPPVAIVITSRYARQSEEYSRLAYSLVLKEVGCLFQTLYLVAESLGLAACALGGGMPAGLLADLCNTTELEEPVVGEFAIGYRTPVAV
jgi:SagB-type dehydrogenase family enzyme